MADLDPASVPAPPSAPPSTAASDAPAETAVAAPKPALIRERLLKVGAAETVEARRRVQMAEDYNRRSELLNTAVPDRYLSLVDALRNSVRAFNATLEDTNDRMVPRVGWFESPNVTLRDAVTGDGMRVRVSRLNSYFDLLLRMVHRSGKPDVPLIEGYGSIGRETIRNETLMRIEGWIVNGQVVFRYSQDFKRIDLLIDEVPDRIVLAVATHDHTALNRHFGPTVRAKRPDELEDGPEPLPPPIISGSSLDLSMKR